MGIQVLTTTATPEASYVVVASHEPTLSAHDFQRLCSVLCAYRFFEIISLRALCVSPIPVSSPTACMFLPGPPSSKDHLDVSLEFWSRFISHDYSGILSFARLAESSKNVSETSTKYERQQFGVPHIPQPCIHINAHGCQK